jgi:hypothetical protein
MKHRFAEQLGEWLQQLWEMGVITEKELNEVLERAAVDHEDHRDGALLPARPSQQGTAGNTTGPASSQAWGFVSGTSHKDIFCLSRQS